MKGDTTMKKTFDIEVDCAMCAEKCQKAIAALDGVEDCRINFILQKLTLTAPDDTFDEILKAVVEKAARVEPDARITVD